MNIVLEQFIPSDRTKKTSDILKKISSVLAVIGILIILSSLLIGVIVEVIAFLVFIASYLIYIDYEYELYNENITITNIYNESKRRVVQKINKNNVKKVYVAKEKDNKKKGVLSLYNTNIKDLKVYTFELNNNKVVELALNKEMENAVKRIYNKNTAFLNC